MNLDDLRARRHPDRRPRGLQRRRTCARPATRRARSTTARSSAGSSSRSTSRSSRTASLKGLGLSAREEFRCRNFFCLGHRVVALPPADRADRGVDRGQVQEEPEAGRGQPPRAAGRLQLRRERRSCWRCRTRCRPPTIPAGTYRNITGNTATALGLVAAGPARPACRSSSAATRSRPASDVLHELVGAQAVRRLHLPGRGRDRRHRRGARRGVRRRDRRHDHQRPRHGAQGRDDGPGARRRAAAHRHRHPARRTVDRHADEDRAGGPADGALRPPRRGAAADRGALHAGDCFAVAFEAVRIARPYMTPVILLTDGYLANGAEPWLIPDADALPDIPVHVPHRPAGLLPVPARRGDAVASVGACRARPGSSTASAASRRRPSPATSATRR